MKGSMRALVAVWMVALILPILSVSAQEKQPAAAGAAPTKAAAAGQVDALKKAQEKAAVAADSDSYVIGPEDVLYIYVWKEDNL